MYESVKPKRMGLSRQFALSANRRQFSGFSAKLFANFVHFRGLDGMFFSPEQTSKQVSL
jgi:hypothetical protein